MKEISYIKITVDCPHNHTKQQMEIPFATISKDKDFYFPVNGCDNCNGSDICQKCCAALSIMFQAGYKVEIGQIVIPDFEVLK